MTKLTSENQKLQNISGGNTGTAPSKLGIVPALACNFLIPGGAAFAAGKTAKGVVEFLTLNYLGIGALVDVIKLLSKNYEDSEGKKLENWL